MTQPIPVIIPINHNTQRNCIVENGKTYCEYKEPSNKEMGTVVISIVIFFVYIIFLCWLAIDVLDKFWVLLVGILGPLLILGIVLLFI